MIIGPPVSFRSLGFLVASQHEWMRDLLHFALEAFHAEDVRDASSGWEVLRMVGEFRPDVVLIDMELPAVGTPEITRCVRSSLLHNGTQPAILAFAERPIQECVVRTIAAGADDVLCLPFSATFLSQRIVRALVDHRPRAEGFQGPRAAERNGAPEWPATGIAAVDTRQHPLLTPEEIGRAHV